MEQAVSGRKANGKAVLFQNLKQILLDFDGQPTDRLPTDVPISNSEQVSYVSIEAGISVKVRASSATSQASRIAILTKRVDYDSPRKDTAE